MKLKRAFGIVLSLVFIVLCFAGCSGEAPSQSMGSVDKEWYNGVYDSVENAEVVELPEEDSVAVQNQKLIREISLEAETDNLDALLSGLQTKVAAMNGYIEEQTVRNSGSKTGEYRYAELTIRVPASQMDAFVEHINGASNVTYYQESAEDITLQYVATESRVSALETERDRLMALMEEAENMSDLLQIEERLTDVLTELEKVASQLRLYDNLVDYSTIYLYVSQVVEFTVTEEQSVWQRIATGFADNLSSLGNGLVEFFIWFVIAIPYLAFFGAIAAVAVVVTKFHKKKKQAAKPEIKKEEA